MRKFNTLVSNARQIIEQKYREIVCFNEPHKCATRPVQMTTKELREVLLRHGDYIQIMASGQMWGCHIRHRSLGAGVYSVWLAFVVTKI